MPNETIHNKIEEWLAADVHGQLADEERAAFEQHLAACTSCRALQEEEKQMHQLLENTLATESADLAFEQRMVRRFRDTLPASNRGLSMFLASLLRMRAAQITAAAAMLLTLVQVGKMITGEQPLHSGAQQSIALALAPRAKDGDVIDQPLTSLSNRPTAEQAAPRAMEDEVTSALAPGAP